MSRIGAEGRLQRLIVMVPWVINEDGPLVEDVCARFAITEAELAADLELLYLCGLYPFTPDTLIEADIVGGRVWIRSADQFQAPPRFTAEEAVGLLAAASAAATLPGNEHNQTLQSALAKLARALGFDGDDDVVDIDLAKAAPTVLDDVRRATETHVALSFDYYSYGRDAWGRRNVQPLRLFNSESQWYLIATDEATRDDRNFRLDRMRNVSVTQRGFVAPKALPDARTYRPRSEDPVVVLDLDPQATWVVDQYPTEQSERHLDGSATATLRISEIAWLERLLLRLGSHARVVEGKAIGAVAANRVLRRYATSTEVARQSATHRSSPERQS